MFDKQCRKCDKMMPLAGWCYVSTSSVPSRDGRSRNYLRLNLLPFIILVSSGFDCSFYYVNSLSCHTIEHLGSHIWRDLNIFSILSRKIYPWHSLYKIDLHINCIQITKEALVFWADCLLSILNVLIVVCYKEFRRR